MFSVSGSPYHTTAPLVATLQSQPAEFCLFKARLCAAVLHTTTGGDTHGMSLTPTYGSMMDESDKGNEHSAAAVTAQETHSDNADASSASPTASNQGSGDNTAQPGADPGQGSYQGYQGSSRVDNRSTRVAGMFKGVGKRFGTTVTKGAHLITGGLKDWVKHNPDIPSFRTFFRHAHFHKSYLGMFISFVFYGLVIWHSLLSHDRTVKGLLWVFVVVWFAIMQLLLKFLVLREPRAKDTQEELEMSPIRDTPINTLLTRMLTLELYRDADKTVKYQFSQMRRVIFGSVVFTSCLQVQFQGTVRCGMFFSLMFLPSFLRSFVPSFLRSFVSSFLRSFVPSFLRSFVPLFLASLLPCFLASLLPCFLSSFLPCLLPFLLPCLLPCLLACFLSSFLLSFLLSLLPCFLASFLPFFLLSFLPCFLSSLLPCFLASFLASLLPCLLPCLLASFLLSFLPSFPPDYPVVPSVGFIHCSSRVPRHLLRCGENT